MSGRWPCSGWSGEAIEQLRQFWLSDLSTAEIGRRMGISKHAVVGKAHRLKLPARPSPIKPARPASIPLAGRRQDSAREYERAIARQFSAPAPMPATGGDHRRPLPARIERLEVPRAPVVIKGGCRWPMWNSRPANPIEPEFCNADRELGRPYCGDHCRRAYRRFCTAEAAA